MCKSLTTVTNLTKANKVICLAVSSLQDGGDSSGDALHLRLQCRHSVSITPSQPNMPAPDPIPTILAQTRTVAVVGFSSKPARAGYYVPEYLQAQGYHIIPVNPNLSAALGQPAYPDLLSLPEPVDLVLIFRRSEEVAPVVDQAIAIGAKAVWMQQGIVDQASAARARTAGLLVVMDACMLVEHRRWRTIKP